MMVPFRSVLAILVILAGMILPATLRADEDKEALMQALRMGDTIAVLRNEGLAYGETLGNDMLPGGADRAWMAIVDRIYDAQRLETLVRQTFSESFRAEAAALTAFFGSPDGAQIIEAELSARRAFIDDAVEDAAEQAWRDTAPDDPRLARIESYIEVNDLLESNVSGALNSNFMFYRGLSEGGALDMSEAEMLDDVWSQEDEIRRDTEVWLNSYLLLAYSGLSDATLDAYIAISETPQGQALNRALFDAFNRMNDEISYALGLAIADRMRGQDL